MYNYELSTEQGQSRIIAYKHKMLIKGGSMPYILKKKCCYKRYTVGNECLDSRSNNVHIYDNEKRRNVTWCHGSQAYDRASELNKDWIKGGSYIPCDNNCKECDWFDTTTVMVSEQEYEEWRTK